MIHPIFQFASAFLLALLMGSSAASKIGQREILEGVISNYRILPSRLVRPTAFVLPMLECAICLALLLPVLRSSASLAALLLIGVFTMAIGVNLARGRTWIDCGCFSATLRQPISWGVIARNAFFMIAATLPLIKENDRATGMWELAVAVVMAVALFVLSLSFGLIMPAYSAQDRHDFLESETAVRNQ